MTIGRRRLGRNNRRSRPGDGRGAGHGITGHHHLRLGVDGGVVGEGMGDAHALFTLGDLQFGDTGLLNQVDQLLEFA
jgi:hypothetical protein